MKISIGHRLFASVLLAILAVAAGAVFLLRQNVLAGFGDYAAGIELDRLDELSGALAREYRDHGGWSFVPTGDGRRGWIAREMLRLQELRDGDTPRVAVPAPPAPPQPARAPQPAAAPAPCTGASDSPKLPQNVGWAPVPTRSSSTTRRRPRGHECPPYKINDLATTASAVPAVPAAPPAPPVPPLPPLPPPRIPAIEAELGNLDTGLHQRVTLLDAQGAYLAGKPAGTTPLRSRAIEVDGRTVGYLAVARSQLPSDAMAYAFLEQLRASLWFIVGAAVALSALAAVLLAAHFRKPIHRLAAGARDLADGRFDVRLAESRSDELGELARSFNQLAQRLGSAEQSRRQWVADTSHELRTPLSVLRAQLEAIQDGVRKSDPDTVAAMLRQVLSLNGLIDQLYTLARADVGALECQRVPLDLWALATQCAAGFGDKLQAARLELAIGPAPSPATVTADAERMRQVFTNLLENALRYTAAGGRIALHGEAAGGQLTITLDDSAPGVPIEALARLSERFYRVDASRSRAQGGAGLGLALCRRILEAHGATLAFAHSPLGGLRVSITFALECA